MADRIVAVGLTVNTAQYVAGMNKASAAAAQTAAATQKIGTSVDKTKSSMISFKNIALYALGYGVAAGVAKIGTAAVRTVMEFESALAELGAASMASASELEAMGDAALDAGRNTIFTATEAATAMTELAKAGVSTSDILGGALTGALDLAAAGQVDVAFAAETAATAMAQFNIPGSDMAHVADLIAAGAGKAQGGVQQLAQALQQGGQVASMVGWDFEDTTTALTAFASAGLLGSDAGTSLKTMLIRLSAPTDKAREEMEKLGLSVYDSSGNMVGASELAGRLTAAFGDLDPQARNAAMSIIFGTDAVRAANVLFAEGEDGIAEWSEKVDDAGYAAEVAAQKADTLSGDLQKLKGTIEAMTIASSGGLLGGLRDIVQLVDNVINGVNTLNNLFPTFEAPTTGQEFKFDLFTGAAFQFGDMLYYLNDLSNEARGTSRSLDELSGKMLRLAEAEEQADADDMVASFSTLPGYLSEAERWASITGETFGDMGDEAEDAEQQIEDLADSIRNMGSKFAAADEAGDKLAGMIDDLINGAGVLTDEYVELEGALSEANGGMRAQTDEGRDAREALRELAATALETAAAQVELDGDTERATRTTEEARKKFIEVAVQLGMTRQQAEVYANQLGLIPGQVRTGITLYGADGAIAAAARVRAALLGIPDRYVNVFVTESRRESALASNSTSGIQPARKDGGWIGRGYAPGGWVSGPGGPRSDSIRAWLSDGEFVVNARAASDYGPLLEAINSGKMGGGFQVNMGGINGSTPQATAQAVVNALRAQSYLMGV